MNKKFLIPSLLAAGFAAGDSVAAVPPHALSFDNAKTPMFDVFRQTHTYTLAGHSSHSSHASHASHRSSSGSGYTAPRLATPTPAPLYSPPTVTNPRVLPGNSAAFQRIAIQVQTALTAYGYYDGPIDGIIGAGSKSALSRFQADYHLHVTGTITPEVLDAFGISAN